MVKWQRFVVFRNQFCGIFQGYKFYLSFFSSVSIKVEDNFGFLYFFCSSETEFNPKLGTKLIFLQLKNPKFNIIFRQKIFIFSLITFSNKKYKTKITHNDIDYHFKTKVNEMFFDAKTFNAFATLHNDESSCTRIASHIECFGDLFKTISAFRQN